MSVAIALLMFVGTESIEYQLNTGNGLLSTCTYEGDNQSEVEYNFGTCVGFIKGVTNTFATIELASNNKSTLCARESMDNRQLRDIVVDALKSNPKSRDETPVPLIIRAMRDAFPCRTGKKP